MEKLLKRIRENSPSIVLITLFVVFISGQSFAGWQVRNDNLLLHSHASIGYWHYVSTGTFWEGLASNWQAALLPIGSLIMFSRYLYQQGAPHSLDPGKPKGKQKRRRETLYFSWIYRNSLSLTFLLLFVRSFTLPAFSGVHGCCDKKIRRKLSQSNPAPKKPVKQMNKRLL